MSDTGRKLTIALAGAVLLVAPAPVDAQLVLEAHGGASFPTGDFESFIDDTGGSLGLGVGWHLTPRLEVRADGGVNFFNETINQATGAEVPDFQLYHYEVGADYELTRPEESRWDVSANLQGGLTTVDSDTIRPGPELSDFTETYPSLGGGVKFGYDVSEEKRPHIEFYAGGMVRLVFTDEEDTQRFAPLGQEFPEEGTSTLVMFPVEAGVALHF